MRGPMRLLHAPGLGFAPVPPPRARGPMVPGSLAYQQQLGLVEQPALPEGIESDPRFDQFEKIPAWYVVSVTLGGAANDTQTNGVQLRPEPFVLKRITWGTTGDVYPYVGGEPGYSVQGRAVSMKWADEFTQLFGNQECLISAALGDSNGYLDIPRGALFQGKQALSVKLTRLFWPDPDTDPGDTRFDFCFQGIGLLPRGVAQSGSAG